MIAATMGKVTNRIRQIVAARTQPGLVEPQLSVLDETLTREKGDMQAMFQLIEDSLVSIAAAANGQMMETGNDTAEDEIIREWAKRWLRVFRRKSAVEEAFIADSIIGAVPVGTTATMPKQATTPSLGADVVDGDDDLADIE
jgi:nuclear cap-binding protein subunit 1